MIIPKLKKKYHSIIFMDFVGYIKVLIHTWQEIIHFKKIKCVYYEKLEIT